MTATMSRNGWTRDSTPICVECGRVKTNHDGPWLRHPVDFGWWCGCDVERDSEKTNLESLRVATQRRAELQTKLTDANARFLNELRAAKQAGATERELEQATGITRQRIWQLLNGRN